MNAITVELEAALLRGWHPGDLEVYADHLLAAADPRGHLIAVDLRPRPTQQAWSQHRRALLAKWLGPDLAWTAGHLVQHGFLNELRTGTFPPALLASPAGSYLRAFTSFGYTVSSSLVQLAARPRPWLTRLTIANYGHDYLQRSDIAALIAATPRLEELHLLGRPPFWTFPHPALERVYAVEDCLPIRFETDVTRVDAPPHATGASIPVGEVARLRALVAEVPDCNVLYANTSFGEPTPVLVARLAAAGLVDLRGPMVRTTPLAPRVELDDLELFVNLNTECLRRLTIPVDVHAGLADYTRTGLICMFDKERAARTAAAFAALFELQSLLGVGTPELDPWRRVLDLARTITW